ncbi:signal-regulatory protein beta-2-like [Centropristis striata]|uniref:signal-regulatory protein beta-2-like n=1 Tax=Centropristis striata TaxID=184440 RepID=UPI0027E075B8|nr:signal-regulatory protein beta-2-like [Centropristis striata]
MASPKFVFLCLFFGKVAQEPTLKMSSSVRQDRGFVFLKTGDNFTLQCFYEGDVAARFYWYKQTLGQKPRLISTFYKYEKEGSFHDEFKDNPRLSLDTEIGKNHLTITNVRSSDSATYFCASSYSYKFEFYEGTTVNVQASGLDVPALVHQSASETIQPGDSVTLNCTVDTATCEEEHSVYWFKSSEKSYPGLIYTHGGRNDQCGRKTQTQTCVYNLPMKSLNLSHAGTYYCAVVSCGHILFGNGTKLEEAKVNTLVLVYFLAGALAFTVILSVLLALYLCIMYKRNSCECSESHTQCSGPSTTNAQGDQNEEEIHYAAVREHKVKRSGRRINTNNTECVYSSIRQ